MTPLHQCIFCRSLPSQLEFDWVSWTEERKESFWSGGNDNWKTDDPLEIFPRSSYSKDISKITKVLVKNIPWYRQQITGAWASPCRKCYSFCNLEVTSCFNNQENFVALTQEMERLETYKIAVKWLLQMQKCVWYFSATMKRWKSELQYPLNFNF